MSLQVSVLQRKFIIQESGTELPDIQDKTPDEIQDIYSAMYPELTTASYEVKYVDDCHLYTFKTTIGVKG